MFLVWQLSAVYLLFAAGAFAITSILSRRGLEESLQRPIVSGFGPSCTLWQAWKLFCSFFWERVLLAGVAISCSIRIWLGDWQPVDLLITGAVVTAFPFVEYFSHRLLLHRPPLVLFGRRYETTVALVHRVHHRDPWHMERAINPPVALVVYAFLLPIIFFPVFRPAQAMTGIAAMWLVLLTYEWIHLLIHTSHVPRNPIFKRIWRNHRLHHFKNEHYWYNVSTYGVDALFGTQPTPGEVQTSSTCLTLDEREAGEIATASSIEEAKTVMPLAKRAI